MVLFYRGRRVGRRRWGTIDGRPLPKEGEAKAEVGNKGWGRGEGVVGGSVRGSGTWRMAVTLGRREDGEGRRPGELGQPGGHGPRGWPAGSRGQLGRACWHRVNRNDKFTMIVFHVIKSL
jgi:hypothetical protein